MNIFLLFLTFSLFFKIGSTITAPPTMAPYWDLNADSSEIKSIVKKGLLDYNRIRNDSDYLMTLKSIDSAKAINYRDCLRIEVTIVLNSNCLKSQSLTCNKQPNDEDPTEKLSIKAIMKDNSTEYKYTFIDKYTLAKKLELWSKLRPKSKKMIQNESPKSIFVERIVFPQPKNYKNRSLGLG